MNRITVRKIIEIPIDAICHKTSFVSFEGLDKEHFAILIGDYQKKPVLTRVHSECITGDMFGSKRCDCGPQLKEALEKINQLGRGVLIYLRQEGRGIGLYAKFDAYELQTKGIDTFTANEMLGYKDDSREFRSAAFMLKALSISHITLITNNPSKIADIRNAGIIINDIIPSGVHLTQENENYLRSKADIKKHTIKIN